MAKGKKRLLKLFRSISGDSDMHRGNSNGAALPPALACDCKSGTACHNHRQPESLLLDLEDEARYDDCPAAGGSSSGSGSGSGSSSSSSRQGAGAAAGPPGSPVFRSEPSNLVPLFPNGNGHGRQQGRARGQAVRVSSRANPDYHLTVWKNRVVLCPKRPRDDRQVWIKDNSCWGATVRDASGQPAFILVNRRTGLALQHALLGPSLDDASQLVRLKAYEEKAADESLLWTQSPPIDKSGYCAVRKAGDVSLNLDAWKAVPAAGGVRDGNRVVLFLWNKGWNQQWSMHPAEAA